MIPVVALISSCAQESMMGNTYSRGETRQAQYVQYGRVTSVDYGAKIEGDSQIGSLVGLGAGALLGHHVGGGRLANTAGAIGGGLVGGAVGSHAQKAMGSRAGVEITVRLSNGESLSVVQQATNNESFNVGDKVRVISNGSRTRIAH